MKTTRILALLLMLAMAASLIACGATKKEAAAYKNGELVLNVPAEYADLVVVESPSDGKTVFYAAEKASIEAAQKQNLGEEWGAGWLFSISRVDEDLMRQYLCSDLNVDYFFAKDDNDGYYLFERPSDVRLVREDYSNLSEKDLAGWSAVNEWAVTVSESFVADNPSLTAYRRSNTMLDQYLNRLFFDDSYAYTLSSTEFGPLEDAGMGYPQYVNRLLNEATFSEADTCDIPDGEYYVLSFPDENAQFRFYSAAHSYVSFIYGEDAPVCFIGEMADGETQVYDIIGEWYGALATAKGLK